MLSLSWYWTHTQKNVSMCFVKTVESLVEEFDQKPYVPFSIYTGRDGLIEISNRHLFDLVCMVFICRHAFLYFSNIWFRFELDYIPVL